MRNRKGSSFVLPKVSLRKLKDANKEEFALVLYRSGKNVQQIADLINWPLTKTERFFRHVKPRR